MRTLNFLELFENETLTKLVAFYLISEYYTMHRILSAQELGDTLNKITFLFPKNIRCKNAFSAVCYSLNNEINLRYVNDFAEFGGLIGPGNNSLDFFSNVSKYFGLMRFFMMLLVSKKSNYNGGPVYIYAIPKKPIFANSLFLRHITGLASWLVMKLWKSSDYREFSL